MDHQHYKLIIRGINKEKIVNKEKKIKEKGNKKRVASCVRAAFRCGAEVK